MPPSPTYRALDPDKVVETIALLRHRILERFPGAGLAEVCAELLLLAGENLARAEKIAMSVKGVHRVKNKITVQP